MAVPLNRLYDRISDRWTSWLAVRRCIRLVRADFEAFDEPTSRAMASPESVRSLVSGGFQGHTSMRLVDDDELNLAIAELSIEQRLLLHLFKQGASYREIAGAMRWSDERALHELKMVLCRLADQLFAPSDR